MPCTVCWVLELWPFRDKSLTVIEDALAPKLSGLGFRGLGFRFLVRG